MIRIRLSFYRLELTLKRATTPSFKTSIMTCRGNQGQQTERHRRKSNLEERKGRNPNILKEMRVTSPGFLLLDASLRSFIILKDGIRIRSSSSCSSGGIVHSDDVVLDLPRLAGDRRRGSRRLHLFPRSGPFPLRRLPTTLNPSLPVSPEFH